MTEVQLPATLFGKVVDYVNLSYVYVTSLGDVPYEAEIRQLLNDSWVARIPVLPGCDAVGYCYEAARSAIWQAAHHWVLLAEWGEQPVPLPIYRDGHPPDGATEGVPHPATHYPLRSGLPRNHHYLGVMMPARGLTWRAGCTLFPNLEGVGATPAEAKTMLRSQMLARIEAHVGRGEPVPKAEPYERIPEVTCGYHNPLLRVIQLTTTASHLRILLNDGIARYVPIARLFKTPLAKLAQQGRDQEDVYYQNWRPVDDGRVILFPDVEVELPVSAIVGMSD